MASRRVKPSYGTRIGKFTSVWFILIITTGHASAFVPLSTQRHHDTITWRCGRDGPLNTKTRVLQRVPQIKPSPQQHIPTSVTSLSLSSETVMAGWTMSLLALQFACQPLLTKTFARPSIVKTTYVMAQDCFRLVFCAILLTSTCGWSSVSSHWSFASSLVAAGIPASLYAIQNYCSLMAYQNLPPISYNVLNQTKTLSAAFFCYFLLGKPQSKIQIVSLFILLGSALVMEKIIPIRGLRKSKRQQQSQARNNASTAASETGITTAITTVETASHWTKGVLPILLASLISGLAGTLFQQSLQVFERNLFLFSMEISAFSCLFLLASLFVGNPDLERIGKGSLMQGWTKSTWIPIITNAMGGILVGLVTKYAGSVRKGFALVVGLLLSGLLQNRRGGESKVTVEQWVGGGLAAISIWMHVAFPASSALY